MYQRLLVPTDGSDITAKAVSTAVNLAKLTGAQVIGLTVKEPFPYTAMSELQPVAPKEFLEAQERLAARHLAALQQACEAAGVACTTITVEAVVPWEVIVEQCAAQQCDLIVMASHGRRGMSALLLGSETQKVLTHSKVPVLVVR